MVLYTFRDAVKTKDDGKGHVIFYITIPVDVARKLKLKKGDLVEVVITKTITLEK